MEYLEGIVYLFFTVFAGSPWGVTSLCELYRYLLLNEKIFYRRP